MCPIRPPQKKHGSCCVMLCLGRGWWNACPSNLIHWHWGVPVPGSNLQSNGSINHTNLIKTCKATASKHSFTMSLYIPWDIVYPNPAMEGIYKHCLCVQTCRKLSIPKNNKSIVVPITLDDTCIYAKAEEHYFPKMHTDMYCFLLFWLYNHWRPLWFVYPYCWGFRHCVIVWFP